MSIFDRLFKKKSNEEVDVNINNNPKETVEVEDSDINWNIADDENQEPEKDLYPFTIENLNDDDEPEYESYSEYTEKKEKELKEKPKFSPPNFKKPTDKFTEKVTERYYEEEDFVINTPKQTKKNIEKEVGSRLLDSSKLSKKTERIKILNEIEDIHIQKIQHELNLSESQWEFFERLEKIKIPLNYLIALDITYESVIESYKILKARNLNPKLVESDVYVQDMIEHDNYAKEIKDIANSTKIENEYKQPTTAETLDKESMTENPFKYTSKSLERDVSTVPIPDVVEDVDTQEKRDEFDFLSIMKKEFKDIPNVEDATEFKSEIEDIEKLTNIEGIDKEEEIKLEEEVKLENQSENLQQNEIKQDETEVSENVEEDTSNEVNFTFTLDEDIPDIELTPTFKDDLLVTEESSTESDEVPFIKPEITTEYKEPEFKVKNIIDGSSNIKDVDSEFFDFDIPIPKEISEETLIFDEEIPNNAQSEILQIPLDDELGGTNDVMEESTDTQEEEEPNFDFILDELSKINETEPETEPESTLTEELIDNNPKLQKNPLNKNEKNEEDDIIIKEIRTIYVVNQQIKLPEFEGYKFIRVENILDINKYALEKNSLLVLSNDIPPELILPLGKWLKNIINNNKKMRIVTLIEHELTHEIIESKIHLNKSSLDFYFETHPKSLYRVKQTGSFADLNSIFSINKGEV